MKKSIDPGIWGPSGWKIVHTFASMAATDPSFVEVFPKMYLLLPCPACQQNYIRHMRDLPIPSDPSKLLRWSFELHQRVNIWKGKTVAIDFKDVQKHWKRATLTWSDAWTFVDAIVSAHPGAPNVTPEYVEQLSVFFHLLRKVLPMRSVKRSELIYKGQLRHFLQETRKKHGITVKSPEFTCSTEVCQMEV